MLSTRSRSAGRKHRFTVAFIVAAGMVLAVCVPVFGSAPPPGSERSAAVPTNGAVELSELVHGRPYYNLDVAKTVNPDVEDSLERVKESCPDELLPESLKPAPERDEKVAATESPPAGAGTGGWTDFTRAYAPSADPDVTYSVSTSSWGNVFDASGNRHVNYRKAVWTDISQAPDPPGTAMRSLSSYHYRTYAEGIWLNSKNLTPISGFQDSELILFDVDSSGYLHVVYSRWVWGRNAATGDYQHQDENLHYLYRSPDGTWSADQALTNVTGARGMLGAEFVLVNDHLCGGWIETLDRETVPATYTSRVRFIDGFMGEWGTVETLTQWDHTDAAGQKRPFGWPEVSVSRMNGEVTLAYGVETIGAGADSKSDIYGAVRSGTAAGGAPTWSGPRKITSAQDNQWWIPLFAPYNRRDVSCRLLAIEFPLLVDATHPMGGDFYSIGQTGGDWEPPDNMTDAGAWRSAGAISILVGPDDGWSFVFEVLRTEWDGGAGTLVFLGGILRHARESSGQFLDPETIMGFASDRYLDDLDTVLDVDGNIRVLFSTFIADFVNPPEQYKVYYSDNVENPGSGGGFSTPEKLTRDSQRAVTEVDLACSPDGRVLATWGEGRVDPVTVEPEAGLIYSRSNSGEGWSDREKISEVPGSSDIVHVVAGYWPSYTDMESTATGEQQCLFETARYDTVTGQYHHFNKYFTETIGGSWTTPQLVSDAEVPGDPGILTDFNRRVHGVFDCDDPATDKRVLYSAMQKEPTPPSTTYYFAEGTTRAYPDFQEWLCLQNPGDDSANVDITYMLETGDNVQQAVAVPAHSRVTVDVNLAVGPEHDVSARVQSDRLIMAERPMYFDYYGWTGGHDVGGSDTTGRLWYFAEGTTRAGFSEYLTLQNPSQNDATVDITYMLGDGSTVPQQVTVGGRSRYTVSVNDAVGPDQDVSMRVECADVAVTAERPMYFDYNGWTGGHDVMGSTGLSNRWYFAEGTTRPGFDTYLSIQNPNDVDATATITYILEDGTTSAQNLDLPATSRQTVKVNDIVGVGRDVSIVLDSTAPVLAERPMYFYYHDMWPGGHVASGVRGPRNAWYFAEGTTRNNPDDGAFEEWISLQNPGVLDATATLFYMLGDGTVIDQDVAVPAETRVTVDVNAAVGPDRDVSVEIWSDQGIIAERPMYFNYRWIRPGGHVVVGF